MLQFYKKLYLNFLKVWVLREYYNQHKSEVAARILRRIWSYIDWNDLRNLALELSPSAPTDDTSTSTSDAVSQTLWWLTASNSWRRIDLDPYKDILRERGMNIETLMFLLENADALK